MKVKGIERLHINQVQFLEEAEGDRKKEQNMERAHKPPATVVILRETC